MSDTTISATSRTGAPPVDVKAMPRVLRRIIALALRHPKLVALAIGCSLFAALASLALPRLFGQAGRTAAA